MIAEGEKRRTNEEEFSAGGRKQSNMARAMNARGAVRTMCAVGSGRIGNASSLLRCHCEGRGPTGWCVARWTESESGGEVRQKGSERLQGESG